VSEVLADSAAPARSADCFGDVGHLERFRLCFWSYGLEENIDIYNMELDSLNSRYEVVQCSFFLLRY
jgi:hypothetical protein